jgi:hypothetical protein
MSASAAISSRRSATRATKARDAPDQHAERETPLIDADLSPSFGS